MRTQEINSGLELKKVVAEAAENLPEATCTQPFGPGYNVFKVSGKVFAMTTDVPGQMIVTLKCDPDRGLMLKATFETVKSGYHMNKVHWISISAAPGITRDLIEDLIHSAYDLVVQALPKGARSRLRKS